MHEMTYFRAELVQLIVSQSDSELKYRDTNEEKYSKILWILSCCKMNSEWDNVKNRLQTANVDFVENRTTETELLVFEFCGQFGFSAQ